VYGGLRWFRVYFVLGALHWFWLGGVGCGVEWWGLFSVVVMCCYLVGSIGMLFVELLAGFCGGLQSFTCSWWCCGCLRRVAADLLCVVVVVRLLWCIGSYLCVCFCFVLLLSFWFLCVVFWF